MNESVYWLGFSVFPGIGSKRFSKLLLFFGSAKEAWNASMVSLEESGLKGKLLDSFLVFRDTFSFDSYKKQLEQKRVYFLTKNDPTYPHKLLKQADAPFVLYVKGSVETLSAKTSIAVVGTRKITSYGREVTELFTRELAQNGFTVVSGLAIGVDATAHQATIDSDGKTIAVLGCGVDCCSPRENSHLYQSIISANGCIVSELPLGHGPNKGTFPSRNRIIAGLSDAVVVTEGAADSGALITADYAFKYKRPVFAVPGPITSSLSAGPYKLIQKGAKLVIQPEDIMHELGIKNEELRIKEKRIKGETEEESKILKLLAREPLTFDQLVRKTAIRSAEIGSILTLMEVKGIVKSNESGMFSLT